MFSSKHSRKATMILDDPIWMQEVVQRAPCTLSLLSKGVDAICFCPGLWALDAGFFIVNTPIGKRGNAASLRTFFARVKQGMIQKDSFSSLAL
jgi:hypothetical protein